MRKTEYICDRCRRLISFNSPPNYTALVDVYKDNYLEEKKYFKMVSYSTSIGGTTASRTNDEPVHFCKMCQDSFARWLDNYNEDLDKEGRNIL